MSDLRSPYWLASALGLNAAGNTGSNLSSLPPLVIHSMDYFTEPDYLKSKDKMETMDAQWLPIMQLPTAGVRESWLQPELEKTLNVHDTDRHATHQLSQSPDVQTRFIKQFNQTVYQNGNQSRDIQMSTSSANVSSCPAQPVLTVSHQPSLSPLPVVQHSYQPKATKTQKLRKRVTFEKWQLNELEIQFSANNYLTQAIQQRLEKQLSLSCSQIRIWFQNRRQKEKHVSGANTVLTSSQGNRIPLNTISSTQFFSQMASNNHHLPSTVSVSQSTARPYVPKEFSNIETQKQKKKMVDFEEQLETLEERDENRRTSSN